MTVVELEALPEGAVVRGGAFVYQKHAGRWKAWFCVGGHSSARMLDADVVRQPVVVCDAG